MSSSLWEPQSTLAQGCVRHGQTRGYPVATTCEPEARIRMKKAVRTEEGNTVGKPSASTGGAITSSWVMGHPVLEGGCQSIQIFSHGYKRFYVSSSVSCWMGAWPMAQGHWQTSHLCLLYCKWNSRMFDRKITCHLPIPSCFREMSRKERSTQGFNYTAPK